MTLGFIGIGNIASAIIRSLLTKDYISSEKIFLFDTVPAKCDSLAAQGARPLASATAVAEVADYIFMTVKPQVCQTVLKDIEPALRRSPEKCVVTVAAGIDTAFIRRELGFPARVVRVMPNTPLLVGAGASALCHTPEVEDSQFDAVLKIFGASGCVETVDESLMDAVTALSGSGPAYVYLLAKAAVDAAVGLGLAQETALRLFSQTLIGGAEMLTQSGQSPEELIRMVASPGGTTEAALHVFQSSHYEEIVAAAVRAAALRAEEIASANR